jgi:hypothetical protein
MRLRGPIRHLPSLRLLSAQLRRGQARRPSPGPRIALARVALRVRRGIRTPKYSADNEIPIARRKPLAPTRPIVVDEVVNVCQSTRAEPGLPRSCTQDGTHNALTRPDRRPIVSVGGRPRTRNAYPGRDRSPPLLGASRRELPRHPPHRAPAPVPFRVHGDLAP